MYGPNKRLIIENSSLDVNPPRVLRGCAEKRRTAIKAEVACQLVTSVGVFGERSDSAPEDAKTVSLKWNGDTESTTG